MKKYLKFFWLSFVLLSPIIPLINYFWGNWYAFFDSWSIAMTLGIVGYIYFLNAIIMSARIPYFDRLYGHDKIMKFHGYSVFISILLIFIHKLLKDKFTDDLTIQIVIGNFSFIIFSIIILITIFFMVKNPLHKLNFVDKIRIYINKDLKFDYSILKLLHNFTILAMILASIHVIMAYSTRENYFRIIIMILWFSIAISLYIYHKLLRPIFNKSNALVVKEINNLNQNITEIIFSQERSKIKYKPGQFGFFRFQFNKIKKEEHPFTLSSSPFEENLSITVKNLGDFTEKLQNIKKGITVYFDGPYGVFTPGKSYKPLILIAGGIGITPFISILKSLDYDDILRPVYLFWGVKNENDLVKNDYFVNLEKKYKSFKFIPVISNKNNNNFESGYITLNLIKKYTNVHINKFTEYFICGPDELKDKIKKDLTRHKVRRKNIYIESFSL